MPKITYTKEGGSILYDREDWLSGVDFTGNVIDQGYIGNSLARCSAMDPFRNMGYLSTGKRAVDATGVSAITQFLRNGVVNNQSAICVSNGALIQQVTSLSTTPAVTSGGVWPHTISGTAPVGDDCLTYYVQSAPYFFYSYSYTSGWSVGRYDFSTTFVDTFMTLSSMGSVIPAGTLLGGGTTPTLASGSGFPHPLIVADDDIMYIGDQNYVHALDGQNGTNGTFTIAVLTLPKGFVITSFAKTNDRKLAIAGYFTGPSGNLQPNLYEGRSVVWIWNLLDLDPDFAYELHDNYVSEIKNWNGNIIAFTSGSGTLDFPVASKLQILEGSDFVPLVQFGNGIPIRGGCEVNQDEIYWASLGNDTAVTHLNSYTKNPYTGKYIYNDLTVGAGSSAGMLKLFTGNTSPIFFMSSGATTTGGLQTFSGGVTGNTTVYAKAAYPIFPPLKRGRLQEVTITFMQAVAGGVPLRIATNLDKTDQRNLLADITDVTNIKKVVVQTDATQQPLGDFSSLQPRIGWQNATVNLTDAAVIESIKYDFDYINI